MNELEFGTVAMASSDSTFSSLPVGAITIGVTLTLEQDGIPWQNHAVFFPLLPVFLFSVLGEKTLQPRFSQAYSGGMDRTISTIPDTQCFVYSLSNHLLGDR